MPVLQYSGGLHRLVSKVTPAPLLLQLLPLIQIWFPSGSKLKMAASCKPNFQTALHKPMGDIKEGCHNCPNWSEFMIPPLETDWPKLACWEVCQDQTTSKAKRT